MAEKEQDDLEVIFPEPKFYTTRAGRKILVPEIKARQFGPVMRIIRPMAGQFQGKSLESLDIFELMENFQDPCLQLIATVCDLPVEEIQELPIDDEFGLFSVVLEVNVDFFIQRVIPSLSGVMVRLAQGVAVAGAVGRELSNTSLPTGTT